MICRRDRLAVSYFIGKFEWPTFSNFWVMVKKWILRANSIDFWAPTAVLGKVNFFKIALINPFMNRFQNGLLIQRGHVTSEISHHSDIDISKFHSTLFRVIGFFRYAPKISLIRPKFFLLFFSSCWFFDSLRRDFRFFRTTFGFWDFWGSVGTFVFFVWFPPYVEGFVLTPTTGRYAQSTQTMAVSVTQL